MARIPVITASAAEYAAHSLVPCWATNPATADAEIAAVADIGPTIRCRELPSSA